MSEIFNIRRFGRYFAADFKGNISKYWITLLAISLSGIVAYFLSVCVQLSITHQWGSAGSFGRMFFFVIAFMAVILTMPSKCYGRITDRREGSSFLMLPASNMEKYISMVLNMAVIFPLIFLTAYLGIDAIICAIDHTAGGALLLSKNINNFFQSSSSQIQFGTYSTTKFLFTQYGTMAADALFFLMGALTFKKAKAAKTMLVMMGIYLTTFILALAFSFQDIQLMANFISNQFTSVSNIAIICIMLVAVFFRLKTIKH